MKGEGGGREGKKTRYVRRDEERCPRDTRVFPRGGIYKRGGERNDDDDDLRESIWKNAVTRDRQADRQI